MEMFNGPDGFGFGIEYDPKLSLAENFARVEAGIDLEFIMQGCDESQRNDIDGLHKFHARLRRVAEEAERIAAFLPCVRKAADLVFGHIVTLRANEKAAQSSTIAVDAKGTATLPAFDATAFDNAAGLLDDLNGRAA